MPTRKAIHLTVLDHTAALERSMLQSTGGRLLIIGPRTTAPPLCCGACQDPMVLGVPVTHLVDLVFLCPRCSAPNETPFVDLSHLEDVSVRGGVMIPPNTYGFVAPVRWRPRIVLGSERSLQGSHVKWLTRFSA